jgi:subtilisin family serine protease
MRRVLLTIPLLFTSVMLSSTAHEAVGAPPTFQSTILPRSLLTEKPTTGTKRFIVRFDDAATPAIRNKEINDHAAFVRQILSSSFNGAIVDMTLAQAGAMRRSPKVLWVEQDTTVSIQGVVSPTPSWGLDRIDQRTTTGDGSYSFATSGDGVDAYVVDTGVLLTHNEFSGRIRPGYDAYNGGALDCNGHGTHVAGTLAGNTYGVARMASVIAVRVLGCDGEGTVSSVVAGIEWAIIDHTNKPAVMNLSLNADESASLESAVDRAFADGITVVVAAGNSSMDACKRSPSGDKASAITVGATNTADARDTYSNFGSCLDIFAPGTGITSAGIASNTESSIQSGTSMASPHVAGLVARYLSLFPTATPSAVATAILSAATPNIVTNAGTLSPNRLAYADPVLLASTTTTVPNPSQPVPTQSLVDDGTAVFPPSAPGIPGTPVALAGATSALLNWIAARDGGSPLASHVVRIYRKGQLLGQVIVDADTVHTIVGLRAGSSHSFTVAAMNGVGVGEFSSPSNIVIPLKATGQFSEPQLSNLSSDVRPNSPRLVSASRSGTLANIRWSPPINAKADTFELLINQGGVLFAKILTTSTGGVKLYGLKPGLYSVRVVAINAAGASPKSVAKRLRI